MTSAEAPRITEVRGYWLECPMSEVLRNSLGEFSTRSCLVVEVVCDDGHSGWGETLRSPPEVWAAIEAQFAPAMLGSDAFAINPIRRSGLAAGARGEITMMAASAIDIALWDLRGHIDGRSVATLLGGALRDRVAAYASGPFMKPGADPYRDVLRDANGYLEQGFRALKLRSGFSPRADAEIVLALRDEVGPDVALMIDINTGYTRAAAAEAIERCAPAQLQWVEEPLDPFDLDGYRELSRRQSSPIAAGESLSEGHDFRRFLESGAVSIIQPDLYLCGGFSGVLKIAALAESYGVPVLPHVFGGVVNFHASLQLAGVLPPARLADDSSYPWFEYDRGDNPLRSLPSDPSLNADGTLSIPDAPGIGLELTRDMLAPFTRRAWQLSVDGQG